MIAALTLTRGSHDQGASLNIYSLYSRTVVNFASDTNGRRLAKKV